MLSGSLEQCIKDSNYYYNYYYNRYCDSLTDLNCSNKVAQYYADVTKNYYELNSLFIHYKKYGSVFSNNCNYCTTTEHRELMKKVNSKYEKWFSFTRK